MPPYHVTDDVLLYLRVLATWAEQLVREPVAHLAQPQRDDLTTITQTIDDFRDHLLHNALQPDAHEEERRRLRHDLRNLLNLLMGFSYLNWRDETLPFTANQRSALHAIHQTGKQLLIHVEAIR